MGMLPGLNCDGAIYELSSNSFRKPLRDQLRWEGYAVDMVGSKFGGSMKDNVSCFT